MSITFSLVSLINALAAFRSVDLFNTGQPYKAVNWLLLTLFTQIIGAIAFGGLEITFLCLSYALVLFYLNRSLVPCPEIKTTESQDSEEWFIGHPSESKWVMPSMIIGTLGLLFWIVPSHYLNAIAPWLSIFALVSSKLILISRQITGNHYLIVTAIGIAPIAISLIYSSIPGIILIELLIGYEVFKHRDVVKAERTTALDAENLNKHDEVPAPTRSFIADRQPLDDQGVPIDSIIPREERSSRPDNTPRPMVDPSKVLSQHQKSEPKIMTEPSPHEVDDFFPSPDEVPRTIELPKSPMASLAHAISSLFEGSPKKREIVRKEPTING